MFFQTKFKVAWGQALCCPKTIASRRSCRKMEALAFVLQLLRFFNKDRRCSHPMPFSRFSRHGSLDVPRQLISELGIVMTAGLCLSGFQAHFHWFARVLSLRRKEDWYESSHDSWTSPGSRHELWPPRGCVVSASFTQEALQRPGVQSDKS